MTRFIGGNEIQLLRNGIEYFPALESAIQGAKKDIYIQTYIYQFDIVGARIGSSLMQAAQRGVNVNILLDGFGCKDLPKSYLQELERAGVNVMFYRSQISPWTFQSRRLRRLHQKVAVIDSKIGFVGGINIIDDFYIPNHSPNNVPPRIDYAVRIEGKLIPVIVASIFKLWRHIAWSHFHYVGLNASARKIKSPIHKTQANIKAAFVLRDNINHRRDIEEAYLHAINNAQSEIIIANAYFVPGRRFRQALISASKRGVNVKLLLQGRMEYFLMFATHSFYSAFLTNGIEIYEYRKSFMHSKVAVIDGEWSTVGSSNIDPFSLLLAREANIIVKDFGFSGELRIDILATIQAGAHQVSFKEWVRGSIFKRMASWLAYGLVRIFLGMIGHSNEH